MQTIEKVLSARNLAEAFKETVQNKGSSGIDKMSVKELKAYLDTNREKLLQLIRTGIHRGWINNIRMANIKEKFHELDGWLRNRIRYCIWHHWKKRERKRKNLIRLGVNPRDAFRWSRSRLGGWAIAQSPILNTSITVQALCKRGYESMTIWYEKVATHKFQPTLFPIV